MNTDIVLSGIAKPDFYKAISKYSVLTGVDLSSLSTTQPSTIASTVLSAGKQSYVSGLKDETEIGIVPANLSAISTSGASFESQNLTRVSNQKPEVSLPQDLVAQQHSIKMPDANAVPIQIWEGCVLSVDIEDRTMKATLNAKMGVIPEHVGKIDLQWVSEQDADLVKPGAIFYLTLYKLVKRGGTVENSQSIQFRRRPNWSKFQIDKISERAEVFLSKIKSKPIAE